jgi:rhodanese-related sulfurtransferase
MPGPPAPAASIDRVVAAVRRRYRQVEPEGLDRELAGGALVVDIRPVAQRSRDGVLRGSVVIDRNVLEWRLDPTSHHRIAAATPARRVVIVCNEGFSSTLAVGTLLDLGLTDVTDLRGGFQALLAAGRVPASGDEPPDLSAPPGPPAADLTCAASPG